VGEEGDAENKGGREMALLELSDVEVSYGAIKAVRGVSFSVEQGRIVSIIGANGAGKSSTLNGISGLVPIAGGRITFDGSDLSGGESHVIVRRGITQCMEGRQVFPRMTVHENLKLGGYTRNKERIAEGIERGFAMFPILKERRLQMAGNLSGGEQQMLAIARALMSSPRLLMLDEPSLGLAPMIVRDVFRHIQDINRSLGTTILLVEQNARMALSISDLGFVLERGVIRHMGSASDMLESEHIVESYLGGGDPAE
jgi:branched-chain amino acid transport system ATP-binding protein